MRPRPRICCIAATLFCAAAIAADAPVSPAAIVGQAATRLARVLHDPAMPIDATLAGEVNFGRKTRAVSIRLQSDGQGAAAMDIHVVGRRARIIRDATKTLLITNRKATVFAGRGQANAFKGCPVAAITAYLNANLPPVATAMIQSPEAFGAMVGMLAAQYVDVVGQEELDGARCWHLAAKPAAGIGKAHLWLEAGLPRRLTWTFKDGKCTAELRLTSGGDAIDKTAPAKFKTVNVSRDELDRAIVWGLARSAVILVERLAPPAEPPSAEIDGGRLLRVDGKRVALLKGTPRQMGLQHGKLLRPQIHALFETVLGTMTLYGSVDTGEWLLDSLREARRRTWPHTPQRYKDELAAVAEGAGLALDTVEVCTLMPEYFHCSGFAVWGKATEGGSLYHGRVLDYMRFLGFQDRAVIFVHKPDKGNAFANVGYAGLIGSVTGMNEKQIAVGEMGGGGRGKWDGLSMTLLMREVLERADTLDEAIAIFRDTPRTCEYYYVVSDGKIPSARGLATRPDLFEVVMPNVPHKRLPEPIEDAVLLSSGRRYRALVANVKAAYGKIDTAAAQALVDNKVAINSGNLHNALFAPQTLDVYVQDATSTQPAFKQRYAHVNLAALLRMMEQPPAQPK